MPSILMYDNEVEFTDWATPSPGFITYDIGPFMENPLTAKAVILRMRSKGVGQGLVFMVREQGGPLGFSLFMQPTRYYETIVPITGAFGTVIEVLKEASDDGHFMTIIGEIHDNVEIHPINISLPEITDAQVLTWVEQTVTPTAPDTINDIKAVILRILWGENPLETTFGYRESGSMRGSFAGNKNLFNPTPIVGVNNDGKYEILSDTNPPLGVDRPTITFHEIGYVKKSSSIVTIKDPVDENISDVGGGNSIWDFSGRVPGNIHAIGGSWVNGATISNSHFRPIDAANWSQRRCHINSVTTNYFRLDSDSTAFISNDETSNDFFIEWYEHRRSDVAIVGPHQRRAYSTRIRR